MGQYRDRMRRAADGGWLTRFLQLLTGNDPGFDMAINRFGRRRDQREKGLA